MGEYKLTDFYEEYHIINSGINGTCENNPCLNGALCFYTKQSEDYFCQCNTCYSGPFCGNKVCNSTESNDTFFKYKKLTILNEPSYYILASIFFIFIISILTSTKLFKKFSIYNGQQDHQKAMTEISFNEREPLSTTLMK
uniref:EGF-like domain-containing protein n=1 Tax=Parastrongyloides trichosuri TaxID=131310 RepID=A0A0N4ZS43_PARTI